MSVYKITTKRFYPPGSRISSQPKMGLGLGDVVVYMYTFNQLHVLPRKFVIASFPPLPNLTSEPSPSDNLITHRHGRNLTTHVVITTPHPGARPASFLRRANP